MSMQSNLSSGQVSPDNFWSYFCLSKCLNQKRKPLFPTAVLELRWPRVVTHLFEFRGHSYLLVVDYYCRFIKIARLDHTSEEIILHIKNIVTRYGIPEVVVSDNGPQYSSEAYTAFARQF